MITLCRRSILTLFIIFSVFTNAVIARTISFDQIPQTHCLQMTTPLKEAVHPDQCCDEDMPMLSTNITTLSSCGMSDIDDISLAHNDTVKEKSSCCNDDDCKSKQTQAALLTLFAFSAIVNDVQLYASQTHAPIYFSEAQLRPPLV
ncbi:hypothetical protein C9J44_07725 [Photobacterium sp. GB-27]|uniref:hypothetical protein n=1 Tax=unclassified Photobacterium TaxID=2628852 RepID=UPI000D17B64A|nr:MULTISPECIES: hypothetical protein [unclassified Photobacterium]PSV27429.1 hypothetical protein C9J42_07285 [Photobacterium sp. GB-56]PSV37102.1 hypothetical protein C9J44_07725 [Photobacterium sp. GB-27]PSV44701.1 hypothetical protein C9J46_09360 [Photobacterium sp. GB-36]PSV57223.1 hypothetical protein C9J43_08580 [Photobacterium sp. GB-3]